jgi:hypothetical protein
MRIIKGYFAILVLVLTLNACGYAVLNLVGHAPSQGSISSKLFNYTADVLSAARNVVVAPKSAPDSTLRSEETSTPSQGQKGAPRGRPATPARQPQAAAATSGTPPK